ncbi:1955_t:CDS:2, partial [Acaulospora morrowiae]
RFSIMNDACMDMLDQFCNLAESSSDELEHARVVASVWADSTGIPEKKFSSLNINENAGGMNYREVMQKRCQQMTSLYHEQCGMYFKKHKEGDHIIPELPILRTTRTYDARQLDDSIDKWLSEAKQRPYKTFREYNQAKLIILTVQVLVNNILKAGITLKYDDINGSFISFVRISVFAHHEKKTIRETSDTIEFQRITQIGLNWLNELDPNDPFPILLDWISSYHDLYTAKCKKCDKILSHESYHYKYLPSVLRC